MTSATPYLDSLPKVLADMLGRGGRHNSGDYKDPPTAEMQEAIAREALTCGVRAKGPTLTYVVRYLRHKLGWGDHPTPPQLTPAEAAYVTARLADALERLGIERANNAKEPAPTGRISPDPDSANDPAYLAAIHGRGGAQ